MPRDPSRSRPSPTRALLRGLLRAQAARGPHGELARQVVLAILLGELLAGSAHGGPPHAAQRAPRHVPPKRQRLPHRDSLAGRRPRG